MFVVMAVAKGADGDVTFLSAQDGASVFVYFSICVFAFAYLLLCWPSTAGLQKEQTVTSLSYQLRMVPVYLYIFVFVYFFIFSFCICVFRYLLIRWVAKGADRDVTFLSALDGAGAFHTISVAFKILMRASENSTQLSKFHADHG